MQGFKKYWAEVSVFLLEIGLLALGSAPPELVGHGISPNTLFAWQIGVFIIYLTAKGVTFERATSEAIEAIKTTLSDTTGTEEEVKQELESLRPHVNSIRTLNQWEFYERFGQRIERATDAVDISHLDRYPPDENIAKTKYFEDFVTRVKRNPHVNFRRLDRLVPEKKEWIEKLLTELTGCTNFSLRVIVDQGPDKLPHISVQLVDRSEVYLVAVAAHRSPHGPRDMLIDSSEAYLIWHDYFERVLWDRAKPLMYQGKVVADDLQNLIDQEGRE